MDQVKNVVIAHETAWATDRGVTAYKGLAQDAHAFLKGIVEQKYEKTVAEQTRILYGASVKPTNWMN